MLTEIRAAGSKGLGLFARTRIPPGTRILSEQPLIALRHGESQNHLFSKAQNLAAERKKFLLDLSSFSGAGIGKLGRMASTISWSISDILSRRYPARMGVFGENWKVLDVWRSNSFRLHSHQYETALFPTIARINHECVPNAQANFQEEMGSFNVHATRNIEEGEEVSLSYLPVDGLALREERVGKLETGYGFVCGCPACNTNSARGKILEERRMEMRSSLADFAERGGDEEGELELTMKLVRMLEEEGHAGMEIANMWLGIAQMQRKMGQAKDAVGSMVVGLEYKGLCTGEDYLGFPKDMIEEVEKKAAARGL